MSLLLTTLLATAAINPVIGDASWIARYGEPPSASVPERERIDVHLAYVEALLRARDESHLDAAARANRLRALDELAAYREAGLFPRRTDDAYAGRRPRFIDDRGVHCAVGHLVAKLGAPSIASEIDARQEYAYVADIDSPLLIVWAEAHGFTPRELAMIQPTYQPPPTAESTKVRIQRAVDRITLECSREHPIVSTVAMHIRGNSEGTAAVTAVGTAPFALCFARQASQVERGNGAYDQRVIPYETSLEVRIPDPANVLRARVEALRRAPANCSPRPGALARSATFAVGMGAAGLEIEVTTGPRNAEIESCLTTYARDALRDFQPSIWRARFVVAGPLTPRMSSRMLDQRLGNWGYATVQECGRPAGEVSLTARAVIDQPIAIEVTGGDETFRTCVVERLTAHLVQALAVPRRRDDGTYERYFRADADAMANYLLSAQ